MKKLFKFFFQGLLYTVPIVIVGYVVFTLFLWIGNLVHSSGITIHPIIDPFLGVVAFVGIVSLIGLLGSTIFFKPLFLLVETIIEKAPIINIFYTSVKDLMTALFGTDKKYNQPVLVKMGAEIEKIGFITCKDLSSIGIAGGKIAVYFPHSFNFSGNLFIVPKGNITPLNATSSEVMKFVVSGGVAGVMKEELNS
jgi:uncharacterized membrane protein